jgi:hypothetical protein
MRLLRWLKGSFSDRGHALSHYRLGIRHAKKHEHQRAIDEYTAAIDALDAPHDVRAMALHNRALVYAASGDEARALNDLREVIDAAQSPGHVKTAARQKLLRISRRRPTEGK